MKKKADIIPYVLIFVVIAAWAVIDRTYLAPAERARLEAARKLAEATATNSATNIVTSGTAAGITVASNAASVASVEATSVTPPAPVEVLSADTTPVQNFELKNDRLILRLTSRGASVDSAELTEYPRSLTNRADHVILDFSTQTALAYSGIPELSDAYNFTAVEQKPDSITLERQSSSGLVLRRTITISSNYLVAVRDEFSNRGSGPVTIPSSTLRTGPMRTEEGHRNQIGFTVMGVDTLSGGADGVKHWGSGLAKWFKKLRDSQGLAKLPQTIESAPLDDSIKDKSVDWIAAKNKYFVQIIAPEGGAEGSLIQAGRVVPEYEKASAAAPAPSDAEVETVAAVLLFSTPQTIAAGQSLPARNIEYYVGPKKYDDLRDLRRHQVDVLEFGYWGRVGKILITVLGFIHNHIISNYGIAIMLLTLIVRTIFWPLTHKSTLSMKRMAKLQPEMKALREKYKNDPKKLQIEMVTFTRANKINPLAGCLPMVIQIPVFLALFVVLRSAIELRYASFLWIRDLSEPERIFEFGFTLPLLGWDALNLLPLAMAGTMFLQMKVTPSAGDPSQQRMMMVMMPIMMVFMLYNYASGLALYWTTTNLISIGQQIYYRKYMPDLPPVVATAPVKNSKKR